LGIEDELFILSFLRLFTLKTVTLPASNMPIPHVICHPLPAERAQKTRQKGSKRHQNYNIFLHK
jgi:hypothetical protein